MKTTAWITVDADGGSLKATRSRVPHRANEVCFPLALEIPDTYFQRPQLSAVVTFPERDNSPVMAPGDIPNIEEIIRKTTGFNIAISFPPEQDEETGE